MNIQIFVNNPWEENTVVLYDDTKEAAVIDCGCFLEEERKAIQSFLTEKGLTPVVLLNTHLHPDHIFGNEFMKKTYGLETQASEEDNFLIRACGRVCRCARDYGNSPAAAGGDLFERW